MARAMHIHSDEAKCHVPHAVLVFPILDGRVIWVKHPIRGWEPPGGKVENGEDPESAARREVWEESGVRLRQLMWVCEYVLDTPFGLQHKWVYVAEVDDIGARPDYTETVDVGCMPVESHPCVIGTRKDVSFILKDDMYASVWPILRENAKGG